MSLSPYYEDDLVTLYHGDAREIMPTLQADVLVMDPPFGIDYQSGWESDKLARSIVGDADTTLRDWILNQWADKPALVFGSWRIPRPQGSRARLIWDTKGALGMGDLSIPWKPSDQEIYVLGDGFRGRRTTNVLAVAPVQSLARNGRRHPHQKPVALMRMLIEKCPPGVILDPCMGVGSTLVAASELHRRAVGIEIDESYCEAAVDNLGQGVLFGGAAA